MTTATTTRHAAGVADAVKAYVAAATPPSGPWTG